jgi:hypothetical protein
MLVRVLIAWRFVDLGVRRDSDGLVAGHSVALFRHTALLYFHVHSRGIKSILVRSFSLN